jgi:hypothetical protein
MHTRARGRAAAVVWLATSLAAGPGLAATTVFENPDLRYRIELPSTCRHVEGPGTLEAVCAPNLDARASAAAAAAGAFLLEIDAEIAPADAKPYTETEFRQELPEAVCGEADHTKVRLNNVTRHAEADRVTYRAEVTCPEIRFLGLGIRNAEVRYVIAPAMRYRLMARVPAEDASNVRAASAAFFASFTLIGK